MISRVSRSTAYSGAQSAEGDVAGLTAWPAKQDDRASQVLTHGVNTAARLLGINDTQLGRILGLSQPTASRMRGGKRLIPTGGPDWQLGALFARLYRSLDALVGGDDSKAAQWLRAENSDLGGVPLERIQSIEGLTDVVRYLDAMRGRL